MEVDDGVMEEEEEGSLCSSLSQIELSQGTCFDLDNFRVLFISSNLIKRYSHFSDLSLFYSFFWFKLRISLVF